MMDSIKKLIYFILVIILSSCVKDFGIPVIPEDEPVNTTLTLKVPVSGLPTRALTADDENKIESVDVLVFRRDASLGDVFYHRAQTTLITDNTTNTKSFKVAIMKSSSQLQFVVLANVKQVLDNLPSTVLVEDRLRADVLKDIEMPCTTAWNSTTGAYTLLPMWGQTGFRTITDAASAAATINMVRSVAKIDVVVDPAAQSVFRMSEVLLYNPSEMMRLAPLDANWSTNRVTAPSSPDGGYAKTKAYFSYPAMTTADIALENVIYTPEAAKTTVSTDTDATAIIVKGSWNNEADSYYRIDFHDGTNFLDILRNHQYVVNITSVAGRGYPTKEEAVASGFTAINAVTHVLDDGQIGDVVWDGRHRLGVSRKEYNIYLDEKIIDVAVVTNYIKGLTAAAGDWEATVSSGNSWLSFVGPNTGTGNDTPQSLKIKVAENTGPDPMRTGTVTVTAGRLQQVITIQQNFRRRAELNVSDVELCFSAQGPVVPQLLRIEWESGFLDVDARLIDAGAPGSGNYPSLSGYTKGLVFSSPLFTGTTLDDDDGDPSTGGLQIMNVLPNADNTLATFEERRTILEMKISNGDTTVTRTVLLRQFDYAITVQNKYLYGSPMLIHNNRMDCQLETTYSLVVKCNTEWELVTNGGAIASSNAATLTGEPNVKTGEQFIFKTAATENLTVQLTFKSKETGQFSDFIVPVSLYDNQPNCYMVAPGGTVTIPITKALRAWKNDPDLNMDLTTVGGNRTANLIWQDRTSAIASVTLSGNNIVVVTRNYTYAGGAANAVVDYRIGGRSYWSWHIWILNGYPGSNNPEANTGSYSTPNGTFVVMDRNLGARNRTHNGVDSFGLFYQWGRKEPFPGPSSFAGAATTVYNLYNMTVSMPITAVQATASTGESNYMRYAAYSPTVVLNNGSHTYGDWYSLNNSPSGPVYRQNRWGPYIKSEFDPCPKGWKVPVDAISQSALMPANPYITTTGSEIMNVEFINSAGTSIGYLPAAGMRYARNNGAISYVGRLYGWTSAITESQLMARTSWATTDFVTVSARELSSAMSVRCVKIQ